MVKRNKSFLMLVFNYLFLKMKMTPIAIGIRARKNRYGHQGSSVIVLRAGVIGISSVGSVDSVDSV
jgi:hypothetical protein